MDGQTDRGPFVSLAKISEWEILADRQTGQEGGCTSISRRNGTEKQYSGFVKGNFEAVAAIVIIIVMVIIKKKRSRPFQHLIISDQLSTFLCVSLSLSYTFASAGWSVIYIPGDAFLKKKQQAPQSSTQHPSMVWLSSL